MAVGRLDDEAGDVHATGLHALDHPVSLSYEERSSYWVSSRASPEIPGAASKRVGQAVK